jgi:hypothetical protein
MLLNFMTKNNKIANENFNIISDTLLDIVHRINVIENEIIRIKEKLQM